MHYTQQPSRVTTQTNSAATVMYARMQGFITGSLLLSEFEGWDGRYPERLPSALLLDLRDVSGYGPGTPSIARRWLLRSERRGVSRIAFVAGSSVIRTIVSVVSPGVNVQMKCFLSDSAAVEWLEGRATPALTENSKGETSRRRKSLARRSSPRPAP